MKFPIFHGFIAPDTGSAKPLKAMKTAFSLAARLERTYCRSRRANMAANVGFVDRVARVIVEISLLAFAIQLGFPQTGWNWLGWIGVVLLLTAAFGLCPLCTLLGVSTCPARRAS